MKLDFRYPVRTRPLLVFELLACSPFAVHLETSLLRQALDSNCVSPPEIFKSPAQLLNSLAFWHFPNIWVLFLNFFFFKTVDSQLFSALLFFWYLQVDFLKYVLMEFSIWSQWEGWLTFASHQPDVHAPHAQCSSFKWMRIYMLWMGLLFCLGGRK